MTAITVDIVETGGYEGRVFHTSPCNTNSTELVRQAFASDDDRERLALLEDLVHPGMSILAHAYPDETGAFHVYLLVHEIEYFACVEVPRPTAAALDQQPLVEGPATQVVDAPKLDSTSLAEGLRIWVRRTLGESDITCAVRVWSDAESPPETVVDRYLEFAEAVRGSMKLEDPLSIMRELASLHDKLSNEAQDAVRAVHSDASNRLLHQVLAAKREAQTESAHWPDGAPRTKAA